MAVVGVNLATMEAVVSVETPPVEDPTPPLWLARRSNVSTARPAFTVAVHLSPTSRVAFS